MSKNHSEAVKNYLVDCMENPLKFAEVILNFEVFDYHKDFLMENESDIVFVTGRQVGKSTACAIKILHEALRGDNRVVLVIAPTQSQSDELFLKVRDMLYNSRLASALKILIRRETQSQFHFFNGSRIISKTASWEGVSVRGFTPNLIVIDEGAYVRDNVFLAIEPMLSASGGQLVLSSTPFGKRGRFYQAFLDNKRFRCFRAKTSDNPLVKPEYLESLKKSMTHNEYLQEIDGEFVDEGVTYFSYDLLLKAVKDNPHKDFDDVRYCLGVDIARYGRDYTIYTVMAIYDEGRKGHIVDIIEEDGMSLTHTVGRILDLNEQWKFERIYVDETTLGGGGVDLLNETLDNVEGVVFSLKSKSDMYKNARRFLENGKVSYMKNKTLMNQLLGMKYEYSSDGHLKIQPDKKVGHDDYPDSFVLACCGIMDEYTAVQVLDTDGIEMFI